MASQSFDSSGYSRKAKIESDNLLVDEATGDLGYDLSLLDSAWWNAQAVAGGGDVRITNQAGDTAYSFELENFNNNGDGTGTGIIWFDASILQTAADTPWYIYTGNAGASMPAATATLGSQNVWGDYKAVWHMAQDPSAGNIIDSTGNGYDATPLGNMTSGDLVDGKVGKALDFDGSDDMLDFPTNLDGLTNGSNDFGVMLWGDIASDDSGGRIVTTEGSTGFSSLSEGGTGNSSFGMKMGGSWPSAADSVIQGLGWIFLVGRYDSSTGLYIYKDGVEDGTNSTTGDNSSGTNSNSNSIAGSQYWSGNEVKGTVDEIRIIKIGFTNNWQSTHYNNQSDNANFWTTYASEAVSLLVPRSFGIIIPR